MSNNNGPTFQKPGSFQEPWFHSILESWICAWFFVKTWNCIQQWMTQFPSRPGSQMCISATPSSAAPEAGMAVCPVQTRSSHRRCWWSPMWRGRSGMGSTTSTSSSLGSSTSAPSTGQGCTLQRCGITVPELNIIGLDVKFGLVVPLHIYRLQNIAIGLLNIWNGNLSTCLWSCPPTSGPHLVVHHPQPEISSLTQGNTSRLKKMWS